MKRIWSIEEQVVQDPTTGFLLEFTSAPSEADDSGVLLNVWNEGRTRKLVLQFDRNGLLTATNVEGASGAEEVSVSAGQAATAEVHIPPSPGPGPGYPDHGLAGAVEF